MEESSNAKKTTTFIRSFWYNTSLWHRDTQMDGHTTTANTTLAQHHEVKMKKQQVWHIHKRCQSYTGINDIQADVVRQTKQRVLSKL